MPSSRKPGWWLVGEHEVRVARANGTLAWTVGASALFGLLVAGGIVALSSGWTGPQTVHLVAPLLLLFVPVTAAAATYDTVNAPRQSGLLRLPLSLPLSRRDVVAGTAVGRFVTSTLHVLAFLAVTLAVALVRPQPVDAVVAAAGVTVAAVALTGAFVGLAIGWSAATRTPARSLLGCIAVGGLLLRWWLPVDVARYVLNGFAWPTTPRPDWLAWYGDLEPIGAYMDVLAATGFPATTDGGIGLLGLGVLLAWGVVPLALGIHRFDGIDL